MFIINGINSRQLIQGAARRGWCRRALLLVPVLAGMACPTGPRAADPALHPEVVVSASRVPLPAREAGSAVTVITGEQLEDRQVRIVSDVLRDIPGIAVSRSGTMGALTQVRIRGAEGNQTLVLIDGIEVNNPAGASEFQFQNLLNAGIARIEVLRGPQSALWGSDAIGGVINIVTTRPKRGWELTARGEGGSFESRDGLTHVGYGGEDFYLSGTINGFATDGISIADEDAGNPEDDAYENLTGRLKAGFRPAPNLEVELVGMRVDSELENDDGAAVVNVVDGDTISETLQTYGLAKAKLTALGGAWEHVLRTAYAKDETEFFDGAGDNTFSSHGTKLKSDYQTNILFETPALAQARHTLVFAVEREKDEQFTDSAFSGPRTVSVVNYGYVGEYRVALWDQLFLSAALRFDDNDDLFEDATTWRASAAYHIEASGTRLHASAGTGSKNPTLFELFGFTPTFSGNPGLKPETAFGFDVGVEQRFLGGRATIDATVFATWTEDLIQGQGNTALNLPGTSIARGLELTLAAEPFPDLRIDAAYTFTETEDDDGIRLIRRPKHIASLQGRYRFRVLDRPATANLGLRYHGDQTDTVFNSFFPVELETKKLSGYTLVNAGLAWQVTQGVEVFARGENLLDEDYQEVFGYGTPGLAVFAGLRVALGGAAKGGGKGR
ncbi:MAG: TonB-dependent receptor [Alphaproteobacteria bacterium]|nr:TonB-dependent receptor [Alphaproteobacteria bacterium]